jgi:CubicO group peptidase (beta-lactamase class C family)
MPTPREVLSAVDAWEAAHATAAIVGPEGLVASHGDLDRTFPWASVTKLVTALAVHVAVGEGLFALEEPAGPPGATVAHLLAHASGLGFDSAVVLAQPGTRRIYSNPGYDELGSLLAARSGTTPGEAIAARVLQPLGMSATELVGRPSEGLRGPARDLVRLAGELLRPRLLGRVSYQTMVSVAFPGLPGVLPGLGRYDTLDWGLGPELRDDKRPHWTGSLNSPATFGHFGGAGTFLWVDPALDLALMCLTDRGFGPWALDAWPSLSDAVIGAASDGARSQARP